MRSRSIRSAPRRSRTSSHFPQQFTPPADGRHARAELPLEPADPRRRERADRPRRRGSISKRCARRARRGTARGSSPCSTSRRRPITWSSAVLQRARERRRCCKRQAVLFRSSHHSDVLEVELVRRNIPYVKYGGLKFLEAAHVKDLLAVLRWADNPRNRIAAFRVLQLLPGVGPGDRATAASTHSRRRRTTGRRSRAIACRRRRARTGSKLRELLRRSPRRSARWEGQMALARAWYEPHLERLYDARAVARRRPRAARAHRAAVRRARAVPDRAHARSAAARPAISPGRRCSTRTT